MLWPAFKALALKSSHTDPAAVLEQLTAPTALPGPTTQAVASIDAGSQGQAEKAPAASATPPQGSSTPSDSSDTSRVASSTGDASSCSSGVDSKSLPQPGALAMDLPSYQDLLKSGVALKQASWITDRATANHAIMKAANRFSALLKRRLNAKVCWHDSGVCCAITRRHYN